MEITFGNLPRPHCIKPKSKPRLKYRKVTYSPILLISMLLLFINPLPHMPILGSSDSAANKNYVKNMDKWGYNYLTK